MGARERGGVVFGLEVILTMALAFIGCMAGKLLREIHLMIVDQSRSKLGILFFVLYDGTVLLLEIPFFVLRGRTISLKSCTALQQSNQINLR